MGFRPDRPSAHGRMDEFEALARGAEPVLYRVAFRLTGNYDDARDLLQDALLEAFRAFGKFEPGGRFERWAIRIMTNTFIDSRRRRTGRPQLVYMADLPNSGEEGSVEIDVADENAGPEEVLIAGEFHSLLRSALSRLPAEYSTAFVLCDMEELPYAEAAAIMGCPEGTVRSRLYRARHAIRRQLETYLSEHRRKPSDAAV